MCYGVDVVLKNLTVLFDPWLFAVIGKQKFMEYVDGGAVFTWKACMAQGPFVLVHSESFTYI